MLPAGSSHRVPSKRINDLRNGIFTIVLLGSIGCAVKEAGFGGESVRTHALTPKSGYLPGKFP
jgi:hypothetical protein